MNTEQHGGLQDSGSKAALVDEVLGYPLAGNEGPDFRQKPYARGARDVGCMGRVLHDSWDSMKPGFITKQDGRPKQAIRQSNLRGLAFVKVSKPPQMGVRPKRAGGTMGLWSRPVPGNRPGLARGPHDDPSNSARAKHLQPKVHSVRGREVTEDWVIDHVNAEYPNIGRECLQEVFEVGLDVSRTAVSREEVKDILAGAQGHPNGNPRSNVRRGRWRGQGHVYLLLLGLLPR